MKLKAFFIIFKGLSIAKNGLRSGSAPLKRPGVANFANIIKIASLLIETTLKETIP